jgi:uncharacterized protein (TIGR03032 family)
MTATTAAAESGLSQVRALEKEPVPDLYPSPGLGAWLAETGGSLAFTTYHTARVFFVFAGEGGETLAQDRIVGSAMGMALSGDALWITNKEQAWRFTNVGSRVINDKEWDAVFMPRKGYFLGLCDTHDVLADTIHKGTMYELLFVNTRYSCVAAIDAHYAFRPVWMPSFITAMSPEDRCHLNGICARDGELAYATLCGRYDTPYGWKPAKNGGGVVVDIRADKILCEGLSMPHSPRWYRDRLWLMNSGCGEFGYLDGGRFVPITICPGFARGLAFVGDYAVIGLSSLRQNTFASGLAVKQRLEDMRIIQRTGLIVVDLRTGKIVQWLTITGENSGLAPAGITELYDVVFLPGIARPYTPGFSEADLHKRIVFPAPDVFPLVPPRLDDPAMIENRRGPIPLPQKGDTP